MTESSDCKVGRYEECLESAVLDYSNHSLPDHCWVIFHMAQQDLQGQNVTKLANFLVDHLCCSGAYSGSIENLCLPSSYIDDL